MGISNGVKIITISGLDGSGKSTQIELLKKHLEAQGKKVFYFHAINFSIANKLSKKNSGEAKSVIKSGAFKIWLRKIFLKIDLWRFKKLLAKLEKEGCDYLVSDRYFYDNIVNIAFLSKSHEDKSRLVPTLGIVEPDSAVYLKASPEIIMKRERKPDQGLEYLQKKEKLYNEMAEEHDLRIVDGNQDKDKIFKELCRLI